MKAIFTGSIASGFSLAHVVEDALAAQVVQDHMANFTFAEALTVQLPSSVSATETDYTEGTSFICFGTGLGNGFEVFGPFPDDSSAEDFGERNRGEAEWDLFELAQGS